ncbi:phosphatase PAP2 family protein [Clostridium sp.]|uniref:phosphatase PAP2 family protein n=1 Tax=Clostridium sp. TaxID=1506 RepID=UPI002638CF94
MNFWNNIFNSINGLAGKNHLLDSIMLFSSQILPYILLGTVVIVYLIGIISKKKKARGLAVDTIVFTAINLLLSAVISHFFYAPRPFVNDPNANLLYPHKPDSSFPSDHAVGSMSIALGLNRYNKILGTIEIILSILIGISRVYVGHHYPQHVVASFILVIILNVLYIKFLSKSVQKIYFSIEKHIPILNKLVK